MNIPVLFCHARSNYKKVPGFDVYDLERDALNYTGSSPAIFHPPCRLWSRLKGLSTAPVYEKYFALASIDYVRSFGGIVEHPYDSALWKEVGVLKVGVKDKFGGFFIVIDQFNFGYYTRKRTGLYIVGCEYKDIPQYDLRFELSSRKFSNLTTKQRSESTIDFILWLKKIILIINEQKKHEKICKG